MEGLHVVGLAQAVDQARRGLVQQGLIGLVEGAGLRQLGVAVALCTMDSTRCARLPKSLARSLLMRPTMVSWLM